VAETVRGHALGVLELVDGAAPIKLQTLASELRQMLPLLDRVLG